MLHEAAEINMSTGAHEAINNQSKAVKRRRVVTLESCQRVNGHRVPPGWCSTDWGHRSWRPYGDRGRGNNTAALGHNGRVDAIRRSAAALMGLVAIALVLTTMAYVASAFDASNRNGSGLTVVLSLIMFGLPAATLGTLACRLWKSHRPT
jgi:hypothetical protein